MKSEDLVQEPRTGRNNPTVGRQTHLGGLSDLLAHLFPPEMRPEDLLEALLRDFLVGVLQLFLLLRVSAQGPKVLLDVAPAFLHPVPGLDAGLAQRDTAAAQTLFGFVFGRGQNVGIFLRGVLAESGGKKRDVIKKSLKLTRVLESVFPTSEVRISSG